MIYRISVLALLTMGKGFGEKEIKSHKERKIKSEQDFELEKQKLNMIHKK